MGCRTSYFDKLRMRSFSITRRRAGTQISPPSDSRVTQARRIVPGMSVLRHIRLPVLFLATVLMAAVPAAAQESGRAAPQQLTVVELFTSQGCPLCPTADAFLGELRRNPGVLALSFHVDYWDYLGWADPFAEAAYTRRQQHYLDKLGFPYVFTPQAIVDGIYHTSGNKRRTLKRMIEHAGKDDIERVPVTLARISGDQVRVRIPKASARYRGEFDILLLRLDSMHTTDVLRGENAGKTLINHNVVRLMRPLAKWNGEAFDRVVSLMELDGQDADLCAVLVQESGMGRIFGAATLAMR